MNPDLHATQLAVTTLLNLCVAMVAGAALSWSWLSGSGSAWSNARLAGVHRLARVGALGALFGAGGTLWIEAAVMAEVPLSDAWPAIQTVLTSTHYGVAWGVGAMSLAVVATVWFAALERARVSIALTALAVFWYTRAMMSHAAGAGDFSVPVLFDWIHLGLISTWVGEVLVGAAVTMSGWSEMGAADRRARAGYVAALSTTATVALAGIFATGVYAAWKNLGDVAAVASSSYGKILLIKLVLVGLAALLGAFNRFVVMPPWITAERNGKDIGDRARRTFRFTLLTEGGILFWALVLAVLLASTSPPEAA